MPGIHALNANDDLLEFGMYLKPVANTDGTNLTTEYLQKLTLLSVNAKSPNKLSDPLRDSHVFKKLIPMEFENFVANKLLIKNRSYFPKFIITRFKRLIILKKLFKKSQKFLRISKDTDSLETFNAGSFLKNHFQSLQLITQLRLSQFIRL